MESRESATHPEGVVCIRNNVHGKTEYTNILPKKSKGVWTSLERLP
jgi:hypothetical protein